MANGIYNYLTRNKKYKSGSGDQQGNSSAGSSNYSNTGIYKYLDNSGTYQSQNPIRHETPRRTPTQYETYRQSNLRQNQESAVESLTNWSRAVRSSDGSNLKDLTTQGQALQTFFRQNRDQFDARTLNTVASILQNGQNILRQNGQKLIASQQRQNFENVQPSTALPARGSQEESNLIEMMRLEREKENLTPAYNQIRDVNEARSAGDTKAVNTAQRYKEIDQQIAGLKAQNNELKRQAKLRGYADLFRNPDFQQNSQYVSTVKKNSDRDLDFTLDQTYEAVNRNKEVLDKIDQSNRMMEAQGTGGMWNDAAEHHVEYQMSDAERAIYNYLYATKGKNAANEFLNTLKPDLNRRSAEEVSAATQELSDKYPITMNALSVLTKPVVGTRALLGQLATAAVGGTIDPNDPAYAYNRMNTEIRQNTGQNISDAAGGGAWGTLANTGYQSVMSMLDNLYGIGMGGGGAAAENFVLGIMGTDAASTSMLEQLQNGVDQDRAVILGLGAGIVEVLTEKIGLDNLFGSTWNGSRDALKSLGRQIFAEGAEEGLADVMNWAMDDLYDVLSSQSQSEWARMIQENMANGMTESQAMSKAFKDRMVELGLDVAGGALSGGLMGGGATAVNNIQLANLGKEVKSTLPDTSQYQRMDDKKLGEFVSNVAQTQEATRAEASEILQQAATEMSEGRYVTPATSDAILQNEAAVQELETQTGIPIREVRDVNQAVAQISQTTQTEAMDNQLPEERSTVDTTIDQPVDRSVGGTVGATAAVNTDIRQTEPEPTRTANPSPTISHVPTGVSEALIEQNKTEQKKENDWDMVEAIASNYEKAGLSSISDAFIGFYNDNYNVVEYNNAVNKIAEAGITGSDFPATVLPVETASQIYDIASRERGMKYGRGTQLSVSGNSGRISGESARGQSGRLEEGPGTAYQGEGSSELTSVRGLDNSELRGSLKERKAVTAKGFGIKNGSDDAKVYITPESNLSSELKEVSKKHESLGNRVIYYDGDSLSSNVNGEVIRSRGLIEEHKNGSSDIYIRTDDKRYKPEQIVYHESNHADITAEVKRTGKKRSAVVNRRYNEVAKRHGKAFVDNVIYKIYRDIYEDMGYKPHEIMEEMLSDLAGGMNEILNVVPDLKNSVYAKNIQDMYSEENQLFKDRFIGTQNKQEKQPEGPEQIFESREIRFSMEKPVETVGNLIAVHNLKPDDIINALELGGFPMPSIAITKADMGHDMYGEISLVFGKDSIDPKKSSYNQIFGGDAYTPVFPAVRYKPNEKVLKRIRDLYYNESGRIGYDAMRPLYNFAEDMEGTLNSAGGESELIDATKKSVPVMRTFLRMNGKDVEDVLKKTETTLNDAEIEFRQNFISFLGEDKIREFEAKDVPNGMELFNYRKDWITNNKTELEEAYKNYLKKEEFGLSDDDIQYELSHKKPGDYMRFMRDALNYLDNGATTVKEEVDREATETKIKKLAKANGYNAWVDNLLSGIEEKRGIRNNTDYFTRSGNRRSWESLHDPITLDGVVRIMRQELSAGGNGLFGANPKGAAQKRYNSIEEMKNDEGRLQKLPDDEYKKLESDALDKLSSVCQSIYKHNENRFSNSFGAALDIGEGIAEALNKTRTKVGIKKYLEKECYWSVTNDEMNQIMEAVNEIANIPTGYFEAKPRRAVTFDEVKAAIVPTGTKRDLVNRMKEAGVQKVVKYKAGDEADRLAKLNSLDNVRFSRELDSQGNHLSEKQAEFFKNSLARDKNGKLAVVYHSTQNGGFTVFDSSKSDDKHSFFFTDNYDMSRSYTNRGDDLDPYSFGLPMAKKINNLRDLKEYFDGLRGSDKDELLGVTLYDEDGESFSTDYWTNDGTLQEYIDRYGEDYKAVNGRFEDVDGYGIADFSSFDEMTKNLEYAIDYVNNEQIGSESLDIPGTYAVYLNLQNPLIIDTKGNNWDDIVDPSFGIYGVKSQNDGKTFEIDGYPASLTLDEIREEYGEGLTTQIENWLDLLEEESIDDRDGLLKLGAEFYTYEGEAYDPEEEGYYPEGNTTRWWAAEAYDMEYDGVIFRNLRDNGQYGNGGETGDVYVAFDSNQIKAINNYEPTDDPDIRFSRDSEYMAAVEAGDMKTARRMVKAAAKNAGYTYHGYHGTTNDFNTFDKNFAGINWYGDSRLGPGFYFAHDKKTAKNWTKGKRIIDAYISMQNPLDLRKETPQNIVDVIMDNAEKSIAKYDSLKEEMPSWKMTREQYTENVLRGRDINLNYPEGFLNEFKYDDDGRMTDGIREFLSRLGYDGIITENEIVVFSPEQIKSADPVTYDDDGNVIPLSERFNSDNTDIRYSKETNPDILRRLENEDTVTVYRAMQIIDGKLYPPMAARVEGRLVEPTELGQWYRADESNPKDNPKRFVRKTRKDGTVYYNFKLDKANGSVIDAAYNPYWHTSRSLLNDQFSSAYKRPNLVTVECEVPIGELTDGYKAEGAKDSVGEMSWHSGPVSSKLAKLGNERKVILSRWVKVNRIVSDAEAASEIEKMLNGTDIKIPKNVVTPSLREELEKRGVMENSEIRFSREVQSVIEMPEEMKKISDSLATLEAEYKKLQKENQKNKDLAEHFKGETKLNVYSNRPKLDSKKIERIAKSYIREYGLNMNESDLAKKIQKFAEDFHLGGKEFLELETEVYPLANEIARSAKVLVESPEKEIMEHIRKTKILVSDKIRSDIPDYGTWRRQFFGRMDLSTLGGEPVEDFYRKLQASYGTSLFPQDVMNPTDQLMTICTTVEELQPYRLELMFDSYDMDIATGELTKVIIRNVMDLAPHVTYADKQKEARDNLIKESNERIRNALKAARADRDKRIEELKAHYKEIQQRNRLRRQESADRKQLLRISQRLAKIKTTKANRALIEEMIGSLDLIAVSITDGKVRQLQGLREWYDEQFEDPDFLHDLGIEKAIARLEKTQIADMNIEDVRELTNILKVFEHKLRTENKLIRDKDKRDVFLMGQQVIHNVFGSKGNRLGKLDDIFIAGTLTPERAIRRMTDYWDDDPLYLASKNLSKGQRDMIDFQMKAGDLFKKWTSDRKYLDRIMGKKAKTLKLSTKNGQVELTPAMIMSLYLHSKNDDNMHHIQFGGVRIPDAKLYKKGDLKEAYAKGTIVQFKKSQIISMVNTHLTDNDIAAANAIYDYFNGMSQESINAVSEDLYGFSLAEVENYFPINADKNYTKGSDTYQDFIADSTIEGMGFLKERIHAKNPIMLRDAFEVLTQSINDTSKFVGLAIPVSNFKKIRKVAPMVFDEDGKPKGFAPSVNEAISQRWGTRGQKYIDDMISDLEGNSRKSRSKLNSTLNKIRSNYAGAVLTLNLSVAMKQAASYPTAAAVLGWEPLAKAFGNTRLSGKVDLELIKKYTPLLWYRMQGYSTQELGDITQSNNFMNRLINGHKALNWIQAVDIATTKKLWKASEYYVRDNFKDFEIGTDEYYRQVADVYNQVIEETQPNYTTMQRPDLLRDDNALLQSILMFKTQPFQNFNILYDAIGNYNAKIRHYNEVSGSKDKQAIKLAENAKKIAGKRMKNAVSALVASTLVFAAMTLAYNMLRRKKDNYEDKEGKTTVGSIATGLAKDMASSVAGMIPFGTEAWELISSIAFGEKYYGLDSVTITALSDFVTAGRDIWTQVEKIINAEDTSGEFIQDKAIKLMSDFEDIANAFGVPVANVRKLFNIPLAWGLDVKGEYSGQYEYMKYTKSIQNNHSGVYDLLYEAYKNDKKQFRKIYADLTDNMGFKESTIKTNMEKRMKADEGVEKVSELKQRFNP